jgi:hypothetical protein
LTRAGAAMRLACTDMPLLWKVFAGNATVLVVATSVLVLSPATVSFPVALTELVVLTCGLAAMLLLDLVLLRRAFGPLRRLTELMRNVRPLHPGTRAPGRPCRQSAARRCCWCVKWRMCSGDVPPGENGGRKGGEEHDVRPGRQGGARCADAARCRPPLRLRAAAPGSSVGPAAIAELRRSLHRLTPSIDQGRQQDRPQRHVASDVKPDGRDGNAEDCAWEPAKCRERGPGDDHEPVTKAIDPSAATVRADLGAHADQQQSHDERSADLVVHRKGTSARGGHQPGTHDFRLERASVVPEVHRTCPGIRHRT